MIASSTDEPSTSSSLPQNFASNITCRLSCIKSFEINSQSKQFIQNNSHTQHLAQMKIIISQIKQSLDNLMNNYESSLLKMLQSTHQNQQNSNTPNKFNLQFSQLEYQINSKLLFTTFHQQNSIGLECFSKKILRFQQQFEELLLGIQQKLDQYVPYSKKVQMSQRYQQSAIRLFNLEKYQDAVNLFIKAHEINLYDTNIHILFKIGICSLKLKNHTQAEAYFKKCVEINSSHQLSLHYLAIINLKKRQFSKVIQLETKAIQENPEQASYFYTRAKAYFQQERYQEALNDIEQAILIDPCQKYHNLKQNIEKQIRKQQNSSVQKQPIKQFIK